MKKVVFCGIVCVILMTLVLASAEEQTYTQEYSYKAGEGDSKLKSRESAQAEAKRQILERIGTAILSKTTVRDFKITAEDIIMLTAGIIKSEETDGKWDGYEYKTTLKIRVDPDEVEKKLLFYIQSTSDKEKLKAVDDFKTALKLETNKRSLVFIKDALGNALYHVGKCWNEGKYVPQNYEKAAKWFIEADQYENTKARYELGIIYMEGLGVKADNIKAYIWLNKAATGKDTPANAYRELVATGMTKEEIKEAQRLSSESIPE